MVGQFDVGGNGVPKPAAVIQRDQGVDPVSRREQNWTRRAEEQHQKVAGITFNQCAAKYIEAHRGDPLVRR